MKINHFIIHYIQKDKYRDPTVELRDEEPELTGPRGRLTKQGELIGRFVESASTMFNRQRSRRVYADIQKEHNPFAATLDSYLSDNTDFVEFSTEAASLLSRTMTGAPLATGGYMAIADFEASPRQILIIMIRQEEGYAIDPKTLELRQSIHLDLATINVGARIDVEKYLGGEDRPLELVRGLKEVAKYFRTFIGVINFKSALDETKEFASVLDTYLLQDQDTYPSESRQEIRKNVANHIRQHQGAPISLMAIAGIVNADDPEDFLDYANNNGVSAEFAGDAEAVKNWFRVRYKDRRLLLEFDKGLLHESIHWNDQADELKVDVNAFPTLREKLQAADT